MSIRFEERLSDSPYVETITHGWTVSDGSSIRPAECHWHIVLLRYDDRVQSVVVGPLTTAGIAAWTAGAEIFWIKFKLGTFLPHLPARCLLNGETLLPGVSRQSFWLQGAAWQFPDYENADTFIDRLVRDDILRFDPVVHAALQNHPSKLPARTVRHRFLQTTGLSQNDIRQIIRAKQAATLLRQGKSILDTVDEVGYFDQPHLTRALKQWVGHTPAQIIRANQPE